ncbi:MAG: 4-hydroxythreonine-4-phosphate dehydrogenase PdxA [Cyanobacteria bacterium NC_groundwater_1444_Ag_S-0.65um_54_12]|nr:4-hydroxythreonine-4-phosphate dehydrogenase PdxA [Cyanobacteria bacterium NC_groundwater_1444_Ag_S-0.65um_54_12]
MFSLPRRIAITLGDPAGIGPEIVVALLACLPVNSARPVIYGDKRILDRGAKLRQLLPRQDNCDFVEVPWPGELPPYGIANADCGHHVLAVLAAVASDLQAKRLAGVVTGPINKCAVQRVDQSFIGQTEFFAKVANSQSFGMLLVAEPFRAIHVTTHLALRAVPLAISVPRIVSTIQLAQAALSLFDEPDRVIGVCGLNPHAGEGGAFGDEESTIITPAIEQVRLLGLRVAGPLSPDIAFREAARGKLGIVVCMYHDQGHIPLKLIGMERGVNVTIGLPFIRVSVDHGPAFDIAGQGLADAGSLFSAWELANRLLYKY